ncbi:unnamed protein product [Vitrella brassicaformis CCMP3155]|uniref:Uncharacterized protein n=1 Tax=Vitrella brassicaformis (strain CCMP3155) TaxID=1169540 RepID=A0A0G4F8F3_VITBC|nr:unnamed protein product [Vitrella brassicaformis CCMP3155]|eukprot:CEM08984.1 unnamed protein product [Vitrella brassicaformis CCMP3155]
MDQLTNETDSDRCAHLIACAERVGRGAAASQAASMAWLAKFQEMWAREAAGEEVDKDAWLKEAHRAARAAAEEAKRNFDKTTKANTKGANSKDDTPTARPTKEEPTPALALLPPPPSRDLPPRSPKQQPGCRSGSSSTSRRRRRGGRSSRRGARRRPSTASESEWLCPAAVRVSDRAPLPDTSLPPSPCCPWSVRGRPFVCPFGVVVRVSPVGVGVATCSSAMAGLSTSPTPQDVTIYPVAFQDGRSSENNTIIRVNHSVWSFDLLGRQKAFFTPDDLDRLREQRDEASRIAAASQAASMVWLAKFQERWAREAAGEEVDKETWGEEARLAAEAAAEEAKRHFDEATTAHTTHGTTPADASSFGRHCTAQHSIRHRRGCCCSTDLSNIISTYPLPHPQLHLDSSSTRRRISLSAPRALHPAADTQAPCRSCQAETCPHGPRGSNQGVEAAAPAGGEGEAVGVRGEEREGGQAPLPRKCHPDKVASAAAFQQLREAYEVAYEYVAKATVAAARVRFISDEWNRLIVTLNDRLARRTKELAMQYQQMTNTEPQEEDGEADDGQVPEWLDEPLPHYTSLPLHEAYEVACASLIGGTVGGRQKVFVTELARVPAQREEGKRRAAGSRAAGKAHLEKLREMWARQDAGEEVDEDSWLEEAWLAAEAAAAEAERNFDKTTAAATPLSVVRPFVREFGVGVRVSPVAVGVAEVVGHFRQDLTMSQLSRAHRCLHFIFRWLCCGFRRAHFDVD